MYVTQVHFIHLITMGTQSYTRLRTSPQRSAVRVYVLKHGQSIFRTKGSAAGHYLIVGSRGRVDFRGVCFTQTVIFIQSCQTQTCRCPSATFTVVAFGLSMKFTFDVVHVPARDRRIFGGGGCFGIFGICKI